MINIPNCSRRWILVIGRLLVIAALGFTATLARTEDSLVAKVDGASTNNPDADKAWKEVQKAKAPPTPPAEWQEKRPSREQMAAFYVPAVLNGADKARDFYTRFPDHPKASEARKTEYSLLNVAVQRFGDTTQTSRMEALETARLKDPNLSEDERFQLRAGAVQRLASDLPDKMSEFTKATEALQKDFPKRDEVYQLLVMAAMESKGDTAKTLAQKVIDSPASEEIKDRAKGLLKKMESLGKPVAIEYTAVDGREVDLAKMKGKVILIDFWATWCGPCVGEIPNVKATYAKLHDKGFEIVGISFDQKKDALERFVAENKMAWPQFFDGEGWGNKFGKEFGINSIPAMWLIDKKGNLCDLDGRAGLEEKVGKLLAE